MIKKDIALIKKIVSRANDNSIIKCVTCYVDTKTDDIIFQKPKNFYSLEESQLSQYCNFMKKGVSGKLGSTVSEITTRENLLAAPRDNALENLEELEEIAQKVRDTLSIEDNYCIFFAFGRWDIPKISDDSEEVYSFVLMMIQPCSLTKPEILFDKPKNEFALKGLERVLKDPYCAYLYPTLSEGHTDIDHAAIYVKSVKNLSRVEDVTAGLFGVKPPLTPEQQINGFHNILNDSFDSKVPYSVVRNIYDFFSEKIIDMSLSGEDVKLNQNEIAEVIAKCDGADRSKVEEAIKGYEGCDFSVNNLVSSKVTIETDSGIIRTELTDLSRIEKRKINGRLYYLIPAEGDTLDGIELGNSDVWKKEDDNEE